MDVHLLVTGHLADDVAHDLVVRGFWHRIRAAADPTEEDLEWATALSGFAMPARASVERRWAWVHGMGAGHDAFTGHRHRIDLFTRTIGSMPDQMGRYVTAAATSFLVRSAEYRQDRADRQWRPRPYRAAGRAVVLGTGEIGGRVGQVLRSVGFDTIGVNTNKRAVHGFSQTVAWGDLATVLPGCQVLVNLLPATDHTEGRVDATVFGRLDGALYVSTGRGITTDHDSLREALDTGRLERAVLDVAHPEPPDASSWLWSHPRVELTPHVAARSLPNEIAEALMDVVTDLEAGRVPRLSVSGPNTGRSRGGYLSTGTQV